MKHPLILLLMALLLTASCRTAKLPPVLTETKTIIDSILVETKTIDTLVLVTPADTVFINVPISKLTPTPIVRKSRHATLSLQLVDSILTAQCITDSLTALLEKQQQTITKLRTTTTIKTKTHIVRERYIPTLLKPLIWIGGLVLAVILGAIAIQLIKPKWL